MKAVQKGSFAVITQKGNKTANINVKHCSLYTSKRRVTHLKLKKITKRWYYSAADWHL